MNSPTFIDKKENAPVPLHSDLCMHVDQPLKFACLNLLHSSKVFGYSSVLIALHHHDNATRTLTP